MSKYSGKEGDTITITVHPPTGKQYMYFSIMWDTEEIQRSLTSPFTIQVPPQENLEMVTVYLVATGPWSSLALNQFTYESPEQCEGSWLTYA